MTASFVHLHVHSAYSLAEGAIQIKTLIKKCKSLGMPAVAVTDSNNLFGAMEFALEATKEGIQPILGSQVLVGVEEHQLVLLVQSEVGYMNLSALISNAYMNSEGTTKPTLSMEHIAKHADGLICLTGGVKGSIGQTLVSRRADEATAHLKTLKDIFGDRLYIELQRHETAEENEIEPGLLELAYKHDIPLVATNDCYFPAEEFYDAHDALLCIAEGRYVTEDDRRKVTRQHYFKSAEEMVELFADIPEAIQNTLVIAQRCHYFLKTQKPILPAFKTDSGLKEVDELYKQSREGLEWRLENFVYTPDQAAAEREVIAKPYRERLEFELQTIVNMGFPGYFLIVSDFIRWAKDHGIPVGPGRGSGAGSVVAWALKITDLNPLQLGLLFERFLNPERVSMPDFDVDFCQDRRDEVIRYVQERYGYDRVAQIITFGKLQARAVVRDVGRVLQIPYGQVNRISNMIPNNPAQPVTLAEALEGDPELQAQRGDETIDRLLTIALQLEGLYRHASTHAAGVVIGDRPLHELVPLYRDPRSEMPVTQFNMKYVEPAGLVKFDFLGLKTLTVIQKAVEMIEDTTGDKVDILQIPLDDKGAYDMISSGLSTGVFQLESSGMRDTLRKMKPNRFGDIIALVALYRPGPMDNIPTYISVKEGKVQPDYLHPKLKPILEETYGIMVYQEQVMQAAQILSGYTLGGADLLRRAMGKKIKAEMDAQRVAFVDGAVATNQVDPNYAGTIFDTIEKFAGYGFNKSHAAAYALVAYQTAWLKANYPVQFMAALMTLDMGNTDKLAIFKQALDLMDIPVLVPDINKSEVEFAVEGNAVRYALAAIKGVGAQAMSLLVAERRRNGDFKSLDDFLKRIDAKALNKKQLENLIAGGALDSIHPNRAQLFTAAETLAHYAQALAEERNSAQSALFAMGASAASDLSLHHLQDIPDWNPLDKLSYEFTAIGFYLSAHPLDTKRGQLERLNIIPFREVEPSLAHRPVARLKMAGVLIKKSEKISAKSGNKFAFLTLSDSSGVYEVMLFSETLMRARSFLEPGESLLLMVDAELRDDQLRMTVQDIRPLDQALDNQIREVTIEVTREEAIDAIKTRLEEAGRGAVRAALTINLPDGREVRIGLPSQYAFTAETRNALFQTPGVAGMQEV
jgi:DNA polymerase-3 subunit alpha